MAAKLIIRQQVVRGLIILGLTGLVGIGAANWRMLTRHPERLFTALEKIPERRVALVLGANPLTSSGHPNLHFVYRMDATAALFHAGKIGHVLVSGDNHFSTYDEPTAMKAALVARGVPAEAITCDFAGFRTLDSVKRAQAVFGLTQCTIVTQRYHLPRALEIARVCGLDAIGFCTSDLPIRHSLRTELREIIARTMATIDLYVLHRQPRFTGPFEPIIISER